MYLAEVSAIAVNIFGSLTGPPRGDDDTLIMFTGCLVMIAGTPLVALAFRHAIYWQVSAEGLRYVNVFFRTTLTWNQIECVRRLGPFPLYFASRPKPAFLPKRIPLVPWAMDRSKFQRLIMRYAPDGHPLIDFATRRAAAV
jgi:hypothetical protein